MSAVQGEAGPVTIQELAARLHTAHTGGALLDAASMSAPAAWDMEVAYAVQDELTALRLAQGRTVCGYKLGYTSKAMREQMGVTAPNYGPLYDDMFLPDGAASDTFVQPRVEPEVAVVLGRDLAGHDLQLHEIAAAVGSVHASLEVVDSVWDGYRFTAELNTADGSSAAGVVLGPELGVSALDCHRLSVAVGIGGEIAATASAAAASGHPLLSVRWLCAALAARGLPGLLAGQTVITGGLTAALPLARGSRISANFSTGASVSVARP
ncbi:2-keto-4-pentenoate hydratase [Kribbella sp. NPDC051620]|uniref:2-keto-4-pentenoate hydratase n=1 Tax=Kribbella sp. NPDC051620 TaxID=3364120 RepID=UPI0037B6A901